MNNYYNSIRWYPSSSYYNNSSYTAINPFIPVKIYTAPSKPPIKKTQLDWLRHRTDEYCALGREALALSYV